MADLQADAAAAVAAAQVVEADVNSMEPTLADNVLAAVLPVLEAAGWTAPVEAPVEPVAPADPNAPAAGDAAPSA